MPEGITISVAPAQVSAPQAHDKLPTMVDTGMLVPDEVWNFLDITDPKIIQNTREKAKMTNVLKYFWEKNQGGDLGDVLLGMREALNGFGVPRLGSNRLEQMYHFVTIQRQINDLKKQEAAIVNGSTTLRKS